MRDNFRKPEVKEFEEKVISIDRITRVVKGGRRLRFRAIVVIGDQKGRIGVGVEKSTEVVGAIEKAVRKAKKNLKTINISDTTIPHEVTAKYAGAQVYLKPARKGTGVIAGGAVRPMLEVVGIKDILSKIQGSDSKLNNVYATIKALEMLVMVEGSKEKKSEKNNKGAEVTSKKIEKKETKKNNPTKVKLARISIGEATQGNGVMDGSNKPKKTSK